LFWGWSLIWILRYGTYAGIQLRRALLLVSIVHER
jgi:hypothetical protein